MFARLQSKVSVAYGAVEFYNIVCEVQLCYFEVEYLGEGVKDILNLIVSVFVCFSLLLVF